MNSRIVTFYLVLIGLWLVSGTLGLTDTLQPYIADYDYYTTESDWSFCSEDIRIQSAQIIDNDAHIIISVSNDPESIEHAYSMYRLDYCSNNNQSYFYSGNTVFANHQFLAFDFRDDSEEWRTYRIVDRSISTDFARYEITRNGNVCDFVLLGDLSAALQCSDLGLDVNPLENKRDGSYYASAEDNPDLGCGSTGKATSLFSTCVLLFFYLLLVIVRRRTASSIT